ncbi:uncharacterized protein DEA37_0000595 [Paragonimus westermani]|uniref:Cas1p 10 TM acyl transferase domain-containing protein n=1 Tax=Paragonimus westermani TaxID=34504 RepID=A0A5J4P344_9TREM|nr:uncharacterized protein DEA37_0000595 [Paragonimus westermani]
MVSCIERRLTISLIASIEKGFLISYQVTINSPEITLEWRGAIQLNMLIYHINAANLFLPNFLIARGIFTSYLVISGFGHFHHHWKQPVPRLGLMKLITVSFVYELNFSLVNRKPQDFFFRISVDKYDVMTQDPLEPSDRFWFVRWSIDRFAMIFGVLFGLFCVWLKRHGLLEESYIQAIWSNGCNLSRAICKIIKPHPRGRGFVLNARFLKESDVSAYIAFRNSLAYVFPTYSVVLSAIGQISAELFTKAKEVFVTVLATEKRIESHNIQIDSVKEDLTDILSLTEHKRPTSGIQSNKHCSARKLSAITTPAISRDLSLASPETLKQECSDQQFSRDELEWIKVLET